LRRHPVIWNPTAGSGRAGRLRPRLEAAAARLGVELEWWPTRGPGHAAELARRAAAERRELVFALGGDGTYNEVARGLVGSATALAPLPGGTSSVLAYELDIPRPADAALPALVAGSTRPMTVGRTDRGELFLLMLSAGPDALVLERLPAAMKRRGGKPAIAAQALVELLRARLPRLAVTVDGERIAAGWAIVGNTRCYGGPFRATPGADPFRPEFEVVVQRRRGRLPVLGFLFGIPRERHLRRPDVVRRTAIRVALEPEGREAVPYQLDGDPVGHLPVRAEIAPERLAIRLPAR